MKEKKLLYVARPLSGGMARHLEMLVSYFSRREEVALAMPEEMPFLKDGLKSRVKIFPLPLVGHLSPLRDAISAAQLLKICLKEKVDLLHIHGYKAALAALPAMKFYPCPVIVTVHNYLAYPGTSLLPEKYFRLGVRAMSSLARVFIVVSEALKEELVSMGVDASKVIRIYNGVDLHNYNNNYSRAGAGRGSVRFSGETLRSKRWSGGEIPGKLTLPVSARIPEKFKPLLEWGGPKVGTAGRLVPQKGMDIFIRAAARVAKNFPLTRFFLAGEGPQRAKLKELKDLLEMEGKLFFLGEIGAEEMPLFLSMLDLFVLASRSEGLSLSLLEAAASGLPLVGSSTGGIPEVIKHGKTGLLFPPGNVEWLARNISWVLREPERGKKMGAAAYEDIGLRFSAEEMLRRTEEVYATCAANPD